MSKIIVTGGAGFIGSNIVDELIKQGHDVFVIDNLSSGKEENINTKARFEKVDVRDERLGGIFDRIKPDYIFHLAAQKNVRKSVKDPIFDADVNIRGSLNVLVNSRKQRVRKVIFSSTGGAIYGDTDIIPTTEDHPEMPVSPYGVAKLAIDKYLHYKNVVHQLPYVSLRFANVYGPRQDPEGEAGVVAIFLDRILAGRQPVIYGNGKQTRDYIYVRDVVDACLMAMDDNIIGVYNISTAREIDVNQLFDLIKSAVNSLFEKKYSDPLPGEQMRSCLSYSKFNKVSGWEPKYSLEEGLEETVNWFLEKYGKKN